MDAILTETKYTFNSKVYRKVNFTLQSMLSLAFFPWILIMSTQFFLSLLFLVSCQGASVCPTFSCDSTVASNTCAVYVGSYAFKINANGCMSGFTCSAVTISTWAGGIFRGGVGSAGTTKECEAETVGIQAIGAFESAPCPTKLPNKAFQSGQSVVTCEEDEDCLLADGSKTLCVCSFRSDGLGICSVDYSNEVVFADYWKDCGSSNVITEEDSALYWTAYMGNWVYEQSTIECASIFAENQRVQSLFDDYDAAGVLAAAVFWLFTS